MTSKFFKYPFAEDGVKTTVPNQNVDDGVNYQEGWTVNYTLNPAVNPDGKNFPRAQNNQLLYDITVSLQQYQTLGIPEFVTYVQNEGVPYPYAHYARTLYDNKPYESLQNNNLLEPGSVGELTWRFNDFSAQRLSVDGVQFKDGAVMGDLVYYDTGDGMFGPALADGTFKQTVVGFADPDHHRIVTSGGFQQISGLIPAATYYLSPTTPGAMQTTRPATNAVRIGNAHNEFEIFVQLQPLDDPYIPPSVSGGVSSVKQLTPQTIPATNTPTVIEFDTVEFDTAGCWNAITFAYDIPVAGYYVFTGITFLEFTAAGSGNIFLSLAKNGTIIQRLDEIEVPGTNVTVQGNVTVEAEIGDYFQLIVTADTDVPIDTGPGANSTLNAFQLQFISAS